MSYVYIQSEKHLWTAGFYDPQGGWHPESDHETAEFAAQRVHYLNGGDEPDEPENPYMLHGAELERTEAAYRAGRVK